MGPLHEMDASAVEEEIDPRIDSLVAPGNKVACEDLPRRKPAAAHASPGSWASLKASVSLSDIISSCGSKTYSVAAVTAADKSADLAGSGSNARKEVPGPAVSLVASSEEQHRDSSIHLSFVDR